MLATLSKLRGLTATASEPPLQTNRTERSSHRADSKATSGLPRAEHAHKGCKLSLSSFKFTTKAH